MLYKTLLSQGRYSISRAAASLSLFLAAALPLQPPLVQPLSPTSSPGRNLLSLVDTGARALAAVKQRLPSSATWDGAPSHHFAIPLLLKSNLTIPCGTARMSIGRACLGELQSFVVGVAQPPRTVPWPSEPPCRICEV